MARFLVEYDVSMTSALKVMVLRDYLELSGLSIHKIIVHDHFLTIPGEFGADSDRIIGGISIGLFFSLRSSDI